jgi:uncharacterized lipoprotein YddW (UPF0748 family)
MQQVNELVRELSTAVKKIKPDLPISIYVWGYNTYSGSFEVCQDWVTWIKERRLDWINPSGYRYDDTSFRQAAKLNREHVPRNVPYYITIGVTTSHGSLRDAGEVRRQMKIAANAGADGLVFFTWEALNPFAEEIAGDLKAYRPGNSAPGLRYSVYASGVLLIAWACYRLTKIFAARLWRNEA